MTRDVNPSFKFYSPSPALRPYVSHYYVLSSPPGLCELTYPLGYTQLIFHRGQPLFIPELDSLQSPFTVSGQVDFPSHVAATGAVEMIVAVFRPHTISLFINTPPSAFRNMEISGWDLGDRQLGELAVMVFEAATAVESIRLIDRFLISRLGMAADSLNLARVGSAVRCLIENPAVSVARLADTACLGKRQFERVFNEMVGMSPKSYAGIVRFQKSLMLMQEKRHSLADIAFSCGYADQSHFIREFRRYSGRTPSKIEGARSDLFTAV